MNFHQETLSKKQKVVVVLIDLRKRNLKHKMVFTVLYEYFPQYHHTVLFCGVFDTLDLADQWINQFRNNSSIDPQREDLEQPLPYEGFTIMETALNSKVAISMDDNKSVLN